MLADDSRGYSMDNLKLSILLLMLLLFMGNLLPAASQAAVTVTLTPLKERYALDEPIAIAYAIHNDTNEEVHLLFFEYPNMMGVGFRCEDEQCISIPDSIPDDFPGLFWSGRAPQLTVKPFETYQRTIVLNRYLQFTGEGSYHVEYTVETSRVIYHVEYKEDLNREIVDREIINGVAAQGSIDVTLDDHKLTTAEIDLIMERVHREDEGTAFAVTEILMWIDNPQIIAALVTAAKRFPDRADDIIVALAKFMTNTDAQNAIFEIALDPHNSSVEMAFSVYTQHKIPVPRSFMENLVKGRSPGYTYPLLTYLLEYGTPAEVDLVRPLVHHGNQAVRNLTAQFIKKMEEQSADTETHQ